MKPEPSAPAAHVHERAKLWVEWGHQVTIIASAPNFPVGRVYPGYRNRWRFVEQMDGIRVVRVKTFIAPNEGLVLRIIDYFSYMMSAFCMAWLEPKPDVVISTSPHLLVPACGVAFAKLRGVAHVFELRDLWPASLLPTTGAKRGIVYRLLERLELWLYRHSKRILSLTYSFVDDLRARGVPADKIDVVINGANLALFAPRPKDPELEARFGLRGRFVVGYLGTLGLAHGLENVVEAAQRLNGQPVTFFFVGVGAVSEKLQQAVAQASLTNVCFAGRQLKEDMPRFWSVCDVGLIHLRNDKVFETVIPSKIFESMAMGRPIVYVGPRGEGSAIVERHQAGLVVPPEDPAALASAITDLLADPGRQSTLKAGCLAGAPLYSRERQAEGTLEVLRRARNDPK
jgi:colanic acid biosynthesis glycosyl transferase WcaI